MEKLTKDLPIWPAWPKRCGTCGELYASTSMSAKLCSNGFHCCRECVWRDGKRDLLCEFHWLDKHKNFFEE